jgi:VENN motif-containing pre-toxin protein
MTAPGAAGGAGGSRGGTAVDAGSGAGISKRRVRANRLGKPAGRPPAAAG